MASDGTKITTADLGASTREKILDTAEPLFARLGFSGVGLREVADRVGIGKSSLFHHFENKIELYVAVHERVLNAFDARLASDTGEQASPLERLQRWVETGIDALAENPNWAPLLLRSLFEGDIVGGPTRDRTDVLVARIMGRLREALDQGIAAGELRAVSTPHTIQSLIGLTVFHFASGEFGESVIGESVYSAAQIRLRKQHVRDYLRYGIARSPRAAGEPT
jgi:TetR/AcrR family transcriptional regulator